MTLMDFYRGSSDYSIKLVLELLVDRKRREPPKPPFMWGNQTYGPAGMGGAGLAQRMGMTKIRDIC